MITDVCDGYAEHDDGLGLGNFSIDAAPLPHPFCTCLWYVDTDKTLDEIGRELRSWADGEREDERLDKAFGEWEKKYTSAPESGIINTERARRFHRFTDKDGKEIYQYPETGEIQALSSTQEIAEYFTYYDSFGEKHSPIDESLSLLPLDTQKELAEGIEYVRRLFKMARLPDKIAAGTPKIAKAYATYSERDRTIMFSRSKLLHEPKEAFPTAVHEMFHAYEHINGYIADDIFREAIHRLHIRINSRKLPDMRVEIVGYGRYKVAEDNHELIAYAVENDARGITRNKLQATVIEIVKERLMK